MVSKTGIAILVACVFALSNIYNNVQIHELKKQIEDLTLENKRLSTDHQEIKPIKPKYTINHQIQCLAMNIYHEARSESYDGRLAVATVTMNRVKSKKFPNTVCGVVWQRYKNTCQFSWTCDGKSDRIRSQKDYKKALIMAENVLLKGLRSYKISRDVMYYHADSIEPNWEERWNAQLITQVDSHKFYRIAYAH